MPAAGRPPHVCGCCIVWGLGQQQQRRAPGAGAGGGCLWAEGPRQHRPRDEQLRGGARKADERPTDLRGCRLHFTNSTPASERGGKTETKKQQKFEQKTKKTLKCINSPSQPHHARTRDAHVAGESDHMHCLVSQLRSTAFEGGAGQSRRPQTAACLTRRTAKYTHHTPQQSKHTRTHFSLHHRRHCFLPAPERNALSCASKSALGVSFLLLLLLLRAAPPSAPPPPPAPLPAATSLRRPPARPPPRP